MSDRNVSATAGLRTIMQSGRYLAVAAAGFLLLAAMLPVVTLTARLNGAEMSGLASIANHAASSTGSEAAGLPGWLAILAFIAAAASRYVTEMAPYRHRLDGAAGATLISAVLWSVYSGPLATQMRSAGQVSHMLSDMGGPAAGTVPTLTVSATPGIGCLFVLLAPIALMLAHRRDAAPRTRAT